MLTDGRMHSFGRLLPSWHCAISRNRIHPEMRGFVDHSLRAAANTTDVVQRHSAKRAREIVCRGECRFGAAVAPRVGVEIENNNPKNETSPGSKTSIIGTLFEAFRVWPESNPSSPLPNSPWRPCGRGMRHHCLRDQILGRNHAFGLYLQFSFSSVPR